MSSLFGIGGGGNVGASSSFYSYPINQSLRFNDNDSAYLSRTVTTTGNRKTWTFSCWLKGASFAGSNVIWATSQLYDTLRYTSTGKFMLLLGNASANLQTTALFRDPSAWYNLVLAVDTTQSTSTDRVKFYVNGSQITSFSTASYPSLNYDTGYNHTSYTNAIGRRQSTSNLYWDCYLAEINFIDGTALTADSFGETKDGIWIPKAYSGSYGTNGFYLTFQGTGTATTSQGTTAQTNIGDDQSGTGNNFAVSGLVASDVVPDSPTNNFATLNPLYSSTSTSYPTPALSEGNLAASTSSGSNWKTVPTTMYMSSGKWYAEVLVTYTDAVDSLIGFASSKFNGQAYAPSETAFGYQFHPTLGIRHNSTQLSAQTFTQGDIIGLALNMDDNEIKFYKNGSLLYTATSVAAGSWSVALTLLYTKTLYANFGQDSTFAGNEAAGGNQDDNGVGDFKHPVPSGFLALASSNLPTPAIVDGSEYFNTVLYTGNGSTQSITGVGFQPDLTWVKGRSIAQGHSLYDVIRGYDYKVLSSDSTSAQVTETGGVSAVASDGFTLTGNNTIIGGSNSSGQTYAAWNWKAGGAAVSNTDGSITSQVSANTDAGFSIVSYVADGTNTSTVGHGLSIEPKIVIQKNRSAASDWLVYTDLIDGSDDYLLLNSNAAKGNAAGGATATVFNSWDRTSGNNMIAYCFADVEGYSKVGSFIGNGNADGTFVYTGMAVSWLMVKRTNSTGNWAIYDKTRDTTNVMGSELFANLSNAEQSNSSDIDFLSNGFKMRRNYSENNSSGSYIYLAFAETPFKFANAR